MQRASTSPLEATPSSSDLDDRRPRVFLVHSFATEALVGDAELAAAAHLVHVPDIAMLEEQIAGAPGAIVVCEWVDRLGKLLERPAHPFVLVHFGTSMPEGLLDVIGQGHEVRHAESRTDLVAQLRKLRPPRRRTRAPHLAGMTVHLRGAVHGHELCDLGSEGLSFEVENATDVEAFLPGARLAGVSLRRDGEVVLYGATLELRHVEALGSGRYRVGGELCLGASPTTATRRLHGRAVVAGLVRAALETSGVELHGPHDGHVLARGGSLDVDRHVVTLGVTSSAFGEHDAVRGHFELANRAYSFAASIVSRSPLAFRLPVELAEHAQRVATRHRPDADAPIVAELDSPLAAKPFLREVHDVSSSGLAIDFDPQVDHLPVGLRLRAITLTLAGERVRCAGTVRQVSRLREHRARAGIELDGVPLVERGRLADLVTRAQFADLHDATGTSADTLLDFFRESGFFTPEREAALAPVLPEVHRTFATLLARPNRLLKTVVCREGERIVGHISSVRAHRSTYTIQHLAAAVGREAGLVLSLGNAENLIQNADFDHLKIWFHAHNRFPARVFGSFARKIQDPQACHLSSYAHLTIPVAASAEPTPSAFANDADAPSDLVVREAADADLALCERHFVATTAPILLRSDDLTQASLRLDAVHARFAELGLERRRQVLVAWRGGVALGFALVEHASPGLNLYDSLNRFSLHILPEGEAGDATVRRALVGAVQAAYAGRGRTRVSALVAPDEIARYQAIGLAIDEARSMCVTTAFAQLPRFFEHMQRLGVRLQRRAAGQGRIGRARATVTVVAGGQPTSSGA